MMIMMMMIMTVTMTVINIRVTSINHRISTYENVHVNLSSNTKKITSLDSVDYLFAHYMRKGETISSFAEAERHQRCSHNMSEHNNNDKSIAI